MWDASKAWRRDAAPARAARLSYSRWHVSIALQAEGAGVETADADKYGDSISAEPASRLEAPRKGAYV